MGNPTVTQLSTTVNEHDDKLKHHEDKINEHEYLLNGIGDAHGVVKDVADMKKIMEQTSKLLASQGVYNKILGLVGGLLATSIVGLLFSILTGALVIVPR